MTTISLEGVSKAFGGCRALDSVDLSVAGGEFLTVLGPSGSGKSTLLRLIAGLEVADTGRIRLGERVVSGPGQWTSPARRGVGMVFQNYALWPHMTAFEHTLFPLAESGLARDAQARRARETLALVELEDLADRRPPEMSGGQQQRVALARALAARPAILLLDECLSNLDADLRDKMGQRLRAIQTELGVTTVNVTHDQSEALALSDRIAVLNQGAVQQVGTPQELYHCPRTRHVALALGPVNVLAPAQARSLGWSGRLEDAEGWLVGVRPERVQVQPRAADASAPPDGRLDWRAGRLTEVHFRGESYNCRVEVGGCALQTRLAADGLTVGGAVWVAVGPADWLALRG